MGLVTIADETTSGERGDSWLLDIAEERLTLREVIRVVLGPPDAVAVTVMQQFHGMPAAQHEQEAAAEAAIRGWRNQLRMMVDGTFPPATRELPQWGLRAEFWIWGIGKDVSEDMTTSGSYQRLSTDQVRFYPIGAPENIAHDVSRHEYQMLLARGQEPVQPVPLTEVPALVLSEVMRDVDLFVGVASLGNDPTWQDGGPNERFAGYWAS